MKQAAAFFLAVWLLAMPVCAITPLTDDAIPISAPAACLMEQETGTVLYEKDAHSPRHIASVTKIMTLLLIMEAIASGQLDWDTPITATAHAAGMGGSQIWLEEGETMTAEEMVKCITVVSANDCSVAMAEHLRGSEAAFVKSMNERAQALGMEHTHFTNCTGLFDDAEHYSCAYDVAVMARALIAHEEITRFTTIWTDTARSGAFGLSNTNKLIHSYRGATGLKTGFTDGAMYCLAATAERDGDAYVAAVLGADSSANRFESAATLLSHGFATYTLCDPATAVSLPAVPVTLGDRSQITVQWPQDRAFLLEKENLSLLRYVPTLPAALEAPVTCGQTIGSLSIYMGDTLLRELPLTAGESAQRLGILEIAWLLLQIQFGCNFMHEPQE